MVTQQTDIVQLNQVILNNGLPSINFFNGRLLSSEDLIMEKDANNEARRRLGQAIGDGVLQGLEVTSDGTPSTDQTKAVVHVCPGAAINRNGQYLTLPQNIDVSLVATRDRQPSSAGLFGTCEPPQNTPIATGAGVYILVLSPASGFIGQAQVSGLATNVGGGSACGSRYKIEGVRFGLVQLDGSTLSNVNSNVQVLIDDAQTLLNQGVTQSDPASLSRLRNLLAHLCFGTEERNSFVIDPFKQTADGASPYSDIGALAALRTQKKLTDCDVPLALLYWTINGIQFIDMGSVRRRPVLGPPSQYWPLAPGGGYPLNEEMISLQFQEHISQTLSQLLTLNLAQDKFAALRITDYFRYLPTVGMIPLSGTFGSSTILAGFNTKFLDGVVHRDPVFIEGAKVEHIIRMSLSYQPIDLGKQEMLWTYWIRENIQTINKSAANPPQLYLFFVSGHIPYQGNAQYNIARWQYSNFATTNS
jgi:hypothetical protein